MHSESVPDRLHASPSVLPERVRTSRSPRRLVRRKDRRARGARRQRTTGFGLHDSRKEFKAFFKALRRTKCLRRTGEFQLHAEYNRENDLYLPHRISQAFELAQFVRHTCRGSDFVLLTGDFNMEPEDLGCHIIRNLGNLYDAWDHRPVGCSELAVF